MEFLVIPTLIFFIYSVNIFTKKPHLAVFWILTASVVNAIFVTPPSVKLGLNIYLFDLVFIPCFLAGLIRLISKREILSASPLLIIYLLIILLEGYIGLKKYGTAAGVDFRGFFFFATGILYFMSFAYTKDMLEKIIKYWILACTILLALVYFRFVADFLHLSLARQWIEADSTNVRFRVVSAAHAYLLGVALVMLVHRYMMPEFGKPSNILIALFAIAVIVLQHRSVWAATIFSIFTLFFLPGIKIHKYLGKLLVLGGIGMLLLLPALLLGYADTFIHTILRSADNATHLNAGTFGDRRKAWEMIYIYWQKLDFQHKFLGDPFGSGYANLHNAPHNFFWHSMLRTGILGNTVIYCLYLLTLIRLFLYTKHNQNNRFFPCLFIIIIVGQMIYHIPYGAMSEHGILLGIAASISKRRIVFSEKIAQIQNPNTQYYLNVPMKNNTSAI